MTNPDPFLNAWRDDLADLRLKDQVAAPRYVEGRLAGVTRGVADLRRQPARGAPLDTQLLYGDNLRVFDENNGWAWGQRHTSRYVGDRQRVVSGKRVYLRVAIGGRRIFSKKAIKIGAT